jgi:Ala-tRNA(Pro) deacylase
MHVSAGPWRSYAKDLTALQPRPAGPIYSPMPASPDDLFAYLDSLGIAHKSVSHPPVFTVGEARTLRGSVAGAHTKNLFLRDKKGATFLVVALEDASIELRSVHRQLGASGRFSFGSPELLRELLGVEPGSVTPFSVINDKACRVTVVLDAAMMAHEVLNFHPLVNTGTTTISREGLLKFLEATGHRPRTEAVSAGTA